MRKLLELDGRVSLRLMPGLPSASQHTKLNSASRWGGDVQSEK